MTPEFTVAGEDDSNIEWVRREHDGQVFAVMLGERFMTRTFWPVSGVGEGRIIGNMPETVASRDLHAAMRSYLTVQQVEDMYE